MMDDRAIVHTIVRAEIIDRIRASLGRGPLTSPPVRPPVAPAPGIGQCDTPERLSRLRTKLISQAATVALAPTMAEVPKLIAEYLASINTRVDTGFEARIALHPDLQALDWAAHAPSLSIDYGTGDIDDRVGISRAFTAMAETGTLVMLSGEDCPITLCFVPETHIVVIRSSEIAAGFEGVWKKVREASKVAAFPRSINFISGPSRTADIEQTLQLGAHGPLRLHVIVVEDGTEEGKEG